MQTAIDTKPLTVSLFYLFFTYIHKTLKLEQPEFFKVVSDLMFKHDPMTLNAETNIDKYDLEAGTVISRLETATNQDDVATILYEEFI